MKKDYILFDLDGTLTDSGEGIMKCVQYALEEAGITEDDEAVLKKYIGPPLVDSFQKVHGLTQEQALRAVAKYRERYNTKGIYENVMLPGMKECVAKVSQAGKKIALATCKPELFTDRILEYFGLTEYFDVVVGSIDVTRKYKAQVIEEVFVRLAQLDKNFTKERAIMVGDRKDDVNGAKQTGIECVGVRFGFAEEGELEAAGADYIVETPEELAEFLCR